ncbi:MAG: OmpA family protein [Hyphomicrobiales bacterium]
MLAACSTTQQSIQTSTPAVPTAPPAAGATNQPVGGGINVVPGSEEDFMVNVGRRTFFAQGSAELDETAKVTLDKQAVWLNQYPTWPVKIQGFADDPGSASQNVALSAKRAEAVKAYLVSRGVAPSRITTKGYGRDRLVQDCADISCKAQNRRVVTNPQAPG